MRRVILAIMLVVLAWPAATAAQEPAPFVGLEALPAPLANKSREIEEAIKLAGKTNPQVQGQWVSMRRWRRGDIVQVCFASGTRAVHRQVAAIASQWNAVNSGVQFDFGLLAAPRVCSVFAPSEVRVAFLSGPMGGDWSLVARQSIDQRIVSPIDPSMNIELLMDRPIAGREFAAVVLHEFGHALGLMHEHQNPLAACDREYNLPYIYSLLERPPYSWSRATIDFNVRQGGFFAGDIATSFDARSIMLYSFPQSYYIRGVRSPCFSQQNYVISDRDKQALRSAYSTQTEAQQIAAALLAALFNSVLTPRQRSMMEESVNENALSTEDVRQTFRTQTRGDSNRVVRAKQ